MILLKRLLLENRGVKDVEMATTGDASGDVLFNLNKEIIIPEPGIDGAPIKYYFKVTGVLDVKTGKWRWKFFRSPKSGEGKNIGHHLDLIANDIAKVECNQKLLKPKKLIENPKSPLGTEKVKVEAANYWKDLMLEMESVELPTGEIVQIPRGARVQGWQGQVYGTDININTLKVVAVKMLQSFFLG